MCIFIAVGGIVFVSGCQKKTQTVQQPAASGGQLRPYTGTLAPDDGQWVRPTKDYANTRYSTLDLWLQPCQRSIQRTQERRVVSVNSQGPRLRQSHCGTGGP